MAEPHRSGDGAGAPTFAVTVMVRTWWPALAMGAFHHKEVPSAKRLGQGPGPDEVRMQLRELVATGQADDGGRFRLAMNRKLLVGLQSERGWLATTFWITDGVQQIGLRVKRSQATKFEAALAAYLAGSQPTRP